VEQNGAAASKVSVIHNWVDLEKYVPGPLHNGFRKKYNLNGKFVVSYAGVIGLAQGMASLLSAAEAYCNDDRVYFVIAGKGVGYDEVKSLVCKKDFKNVLFLPHLVEEEYIELLRSSDVCLVTLSKNLTTPAIPGKLQCIMAVGRPVICSVPAVSGAKGIVEQAECGIWIDPSDETALSHAIGEMMKLDSLGTMGARGRMYSSQCFDRKSCTEIYSDLLRKR
jgi:colanic acid biosynthesis glycosyl transferase WcaI